MENGRRDVYVSALKAVKANRLKEAFELYCSIFTPLGHKTKEFLAFYRYQLATYLVEKRNYQLGLGEGDMVSDLIESVYDETVKDIEDSEIPISRDGRINILESVEIVFPCQNETERSEKKSCVAK